MADLLLGIDGPDPFGHGFRLIEFNEVGHDAIEA
jgi:hypothetical protein